MPKVLLAAFRRWACYDPGTLVKGKAPWIQLMGIAFALDADYVPAGGLRTWVSSNWQSTEKIFYNFCCARAEDFRRH